MEDRFIGKRLDGRYEIHELLGMGGMAYVYRAYDKVEDRWVAIKVLKEEFSNNSDFLRRFRNESKAIAVLQHPNIVKIYDVSFGDQIQYIVMEYIDGITLKDYIERQGAIRWQETIHFMVQILSALQCAHEKGIIHRDIKPQNIMLLRDGVIKVTDFGIARFLQSETQTMASDKAIGSVHYISPEQARGDFITDKADIYSVGVVMYEMLTGELPFNADTAVSVALMQLQAKPKMPSDINPAVPRGLEQITMRAMEKNPANRFRSVGEMLDDIEAFRQNPNTVFNYTYSESGYSQQQNMEEYNTVSFSPEYDDNYEYEEELVKSKRRRKGNMAVVGIVIALVAVLAVTGVVFGMNFYRDMNKADDDTVVVPNLVGKIYETEVKGNAEYSDFVFKIKVGNDPEKNPGEILNQNPTPDKEVRKGREIQLTVNKTGAAMVTLLDISGYEQSEAIAALRNLNLSTKIESISDNNVQVGHVIRTDPIANSEVEEGSVVTLYVSKGSDKVEVTVPDNLVGSSLDEAKAKIEGAKLKVGNVTKDDTSAEPENTVISVSPGPGETVEQGSSVNIVVSSGKSVPRQLKYDVKLPDVNQDIEVKVYKNGVVIITETVNPNYGRSYKLSFEGTGGSDIIVVQLDGKDYISLEANYDSQNVNVISQNDYVPPNSGGNNSEQGGADDTGATDI